MSILETQTPNSQTRALDPSEDPLLYFTKVFVRFLQLVFEKRPTGDLRWLEDEQATEITIIDESPVSRDRIEASPIIVTQRSEIGFADLAMDSMADIDLRTGIKTRTDLIPGNMFIHCISKNRVEASKIGWLVLTAIKRWRTVLQRAGFHQVGTGLRLTPPTPPGALVSPEPTPEMRAVTCICPFTFRWTEDLIPLDAPLAREIQLKLFGRVHPTDAENKAKNAGIMSVRGVPILGTTVPIDDQGIELEVKG